MTSTYIKSDQQNIEMYSINDTGSAMLNDNDDKLSENLARCPSVQAILYHDFDLHALCEQEDQISDSLVSKLSHNISRLSSKFKNMFTPIEFKLSALGAMTYATGIMVNLSMMYIGSQIFDVNLSEYSTLCNNIIDTVPMMLPTLVTSGSICLNVVLQLVRPSAEVRANRIKCILDSQSDVYKILANGDADLCPPSTILKMLLLPKIVDINHPDRKYLDHLMLLDKSMTALYSAQVYKAPIFYRPIICLLLLGDIAATMTDVMTISKYAVFGISIFGSSSYVAQHILISKCRSELSTSRDIVYLKHRLALMLMKAFLIKMSASEEFAVYGAFTNYIIAAIEQEQIVYPQISDSGLNPFLNLIAHRNKETAELITNMLGITYNPIYMSLDNFNCYAAATEFVVSIIAMTGLMIFKVSEHGSINSIEDYVTYGFAFNGDAASIGFVTYMVFRAGVLRPLAQFIVNRHHMNRLKIMGIQPKVGKRLAIAMIIHNTGCALAYSGLVASGTNRIGVCISQLTLQSLDALYAGFIAFTAKGGSKHKSV